MSCKCQSTPPQRNRADSGEAASHIATLQWLREAQGSSDEVVSELAKQTLAVMQPQIGHALDAGLFHLRAALRSLFITDASAPYYYY